MEQRKKLELKPNEKIILELLFDSPIEGESQYGKYFMYGVKNGEEEYNFFAPLKVHEALADKPRGTQFQIIKTAVQKNRKLVTDFEIKFSNNDNQVARETGNSDSELFSAMLKSYDEATKLQAKYSAVNLNQAAITLFIARTKSNGFNNFYKE
jgi:hypothetical protein